MSMKPFDHDKPAIMTYGSSPSSGEKYVKTHAISAYYSLGELSPTKAAENGSRS